MIKLLYYFYDCGLRADKPVGGDGRHPPFWKVSAYSAWNN